MATESTNHSTFTSTAHALGAEQLPESYFTWPGLLDRLGRREELSESQTAWAMNEIMAGRASDVLISAFAFGLRVKGITAAELAAAAEAMRSFATPVDFSAWTRLWTSLEPAATAATLSTSPRWRPSLQAQPTWLHGNRKALPSVVALTCSRRSAWTSNAPPRR